MMNKPKTLSLKLLKDFELDDTEIDFFVSNDLLNFPLNQLDNIIGDYNNIIFWLNLIIKNVDIDDNYRISKKDGSGFFTDYYYDSDNNIIEKDWQFGNCKYTYLNNKIVKISETNKPIKLFVYTDNGFLIEYKDGSDDKSFKCFYDNKNNLIKKQFDNGNFVSYSYKNNKIMREDIKNKDGKSFIEYQYDKSTGKLLKKKNSYGITIDYEYYDNGQIKSIDDMIFPLVS